MTSRRNQTPRKNPMPEMSIITWPKRRGVETLILFLISWSVVDGAYLPLVAKAEMAEKMKQIKAKRVHYLLFK